MTATADIRLEDAVKHIEWRAGVLRVLDQRELPGRIVHLDCRSVEDVAEATRSMALRGAPLIGCAAAFGMSLAARKGRETFLKSAAILKAARPTAVNLAHAVDAMLAAGKKLSDAQLAAGVEKAAIQYFENDLAYCYAMAKFGAELLPKNARVMTHCNAGALATAGLGTAVGVIRYAHALGKIEHVYPCETRPYLQGSRLTLWELMQGKVPATLITDNMAAHAMKTLKINAVIVGSDRIAANGDVCNKIGTYGLAILAKHHGIPFYAVAPTTTVDLDCPTGDEIPIEERSTQEVVEIFGRPIAPIGARARHFGFDVTPRELVTAIVTEMGVVKPVNAKNLRKNVQ